jgi:NAD(P)H dehydrogenase (quinone)
VPTLRNKDKTGNNQTKENHMYAITGITGNVGSAAAKALLNAGKKVRGVVRDKAKAAHWEKAGAELVVADINDASGLSEAFRGCEGVFVLRPPSFDPLPEFPEAHVFGANLKSALEAARPGRVVYLSTIGAQASQSNLLTQHTIIEEAIRTLTIPLTILRPAWFMENCSWDVSPARERGVIPSFLQPLDKPVPMVATTDIGKLVARLLQEPWSGRRIAELEGPRRVTPNEIAATFARLLGKPVRAEIVPHESWETLFKSQGMKNPTPRIRMLDGFNEGWIDFEGGSAEHFTGSTNLQDVIRDLAARAA